MNRFFQDTGFHPSHETKLGHKLVEAVKTEKRFGFAFLQERHLRHLIECGASVHFRDDLPFRTAVKANQTENALFLLNYPSPKPVNVMANNASAFLNAAINNNPILLGEIGLRAQGQLTQAQVYNAAETAVDRDCPAAAEKLIADFNLSAEQIGILRQRASLAANDGIVKIIDDVMAGRKRQQIESIHMPSVDCLHPVVMTTPSAQKAACFLGAA